MSFWEAVVFIVAIGAVVSIVRARYGIGEDQHGNTTVHQANPEAERLRGEVTQLKDRIAVLERLVTDTHGAQSLDREIEKLR